MKAHLLALMLELSGYPTGEGQTPLLEVLKEQYHITEEDKEEAYKVLFEMMTEEERADPEYDHEVEWPGRKAAPGLLDKLYIRINRQKKMAK